MRKKLALTVAAVAAATTFGPLAPASAVCIDWYYEITGQCSPCNTVGAVVNHVPDKYQVVELYCLA